jgi:cytochrome P450
MWYVSGNRDEAVSERPNEFRIDRPNARAHLAFGIGVHFCMGSRLAEMQLRILWEEILARFRLVRSRRQAGTRPIELREGLRRASVRVHPGDRTRGRAESEPRRTTESLARPA